MKQSFSEQLKNIKEGLPPQQVSPVDAALEKARGIVASDFSSDFLADIALDIKLKNAFYSKIAEAAEKNPEIEITKDFLEKIFRQLKNGNSEMPPVPPPQKRTEKIKMKKIETFSQTPQNPAQVATKFRDRIEQEEVEKSLVPFLRLTVQEAGESDDSYAKKITAALSSYLKEQSIKLSGGEFRRLKEDCVSEIIKKTNKKEAPEAKVVAVEGEVKPQENRETAKALAEATQNIQTATTQIENGEHAAAEIRIPLKDLSEDAQADAVSLVQTQNTKNIPVEEAVNLMEQIGRPRLTEGEPPQKTNESIALGNGIITDPNFLPQKALVPKNTEALVESLGEEEDASFPTTIEAGLSDDEILLRSQETSSLPEAGEVSSPHSSAGGASASVNTLTQPQTATTPATSQRGAQEESAVPATQTLLKEEFKNEEAEQYKGLLEARKASLKKDVEDMKEAMKSVGASGAGYYYKEIDKVKKSLTEIEKKLGRVAEKDASFKKALAFESFEELEKSHLTENEKQKYLEVLTRLNERRATQDASLREKIRDTLLRGTEKYRKLPWYKKVAYGIGIGAVGGALGSMTAATALPIATGLFMRGLGAQGTYLGLKDRFVQKLEEKAGAEVDVSLMKKGETDYEGGSARQKGTQLALAAIERNTFNKTAALWSAILSVAIPDAFAESLRATGAHIPWTDIKLDKGGLFLRTDYSGFSNAWSTTLPVKSGSSLVTPVEPLSPRGEEVVAEKPSAAQPLSTEKTSPTATVSSREVDEDSSVAKVSLRETQTPQGGSAAADPAALEKARIASELAEELKNNGAMLQDWKKMETDFGKKISLAEAEKNKLLNEMFVKSGDGTPLLDGSGKPVLSGAQAETNAPKIAALDTEIERLRNLRSITRSDIEAMSVKNRDLLLKLNPLQNAPDTKTVVATPSSTTTASSQPLEKAKITATPSVGEVDKMTGLRKIPGGLEIPGGSGKGVGVTPTIQNGAPGNPYLVAQQKVLPTAESFGLRVPTTKIVELENKFNSSFVQQMTGMKEAGHPDTVILQNITPESLRLATLDYVKMHETALGPVGNPIAEKLLKTPARIFTIPGNFFRENPDLAKIPAWVQMVSNVENMLSNGKYMLSPGVYGSKIFPQTESLEQYLVLANMQQRGNLPVGGYQGGVLRTTRV